MNLKSFLSFTLICCSCLLFSQIPEPASSDLQDIIPASPTVSNLMKFEEVPVDYYTGIPDISIPIFNVNSISNYPINVSISYHPSGVEVDNISSWIGNGWSLNAGGSISRTVYGKADDTQYGMLNNGFFASGFMIESPENEHILFDTNVNDKYDTEADIFQFNFMGISGRFFLKRTAGTVEAILLSTNRAFKITPILNGPFSTIIGFEIIDDNGYKYIFSNAGIETTESFPYVVNMFYDSSTDTPFLPTTLFNSAWHLTEILSHDDTLICEFNYSSNVEIYEDVATYVKNTVATFDMNNSHLLFSNNPYSILLPASTFSKGTRKITTKKLSNIIIPNKGTIHFYKTNGRLDLMVDSNNQHTGSYLNRIEVKNIHNQFITAFDFIHDFEGLENRLFLKELRQYDTNESDYLPYLFSYNNEEGLPERGSFNKDYWGYYNGANNQVPYPAIPENGVYYGANRFTDSIKCLTGVLTEIKHPTDGIKKFNFEANTYSYIGNQLKENIDIPENRNYVFQGPNLYNSTNDFELVYIDQNQIVNTTLEALDHNYFTFEDDIKGYRIRLYPKTLTEAYQNQEPGPGGIMPQVTLNDLEPDLDRENLEVFVDSCSEPSNPITDFSVDKSLIMEKGWYLIVLENTDCLSHYQVSFNFSYSYYNLNNNFKFYKGGGLRIKDIQFMDDNEVLMTKNYLYNMFDNSELSSGSIISFPLYSYDIKRSALYRKTISTWGVKDFNYKVTSDYNNLNLQKLKGNIGYKNIEVTQTNNGKQQFTYTSPIDYPENNDIDNYPFLAGFNFDYKRGLLTKTKIISESNETLKQETNEYTIDENLITTGYKIFNPQFKSCGYTKLVNVYQNYVNIGNPYKCFGPIPAYQGGFIAVTPTQTSSGWAKLTTILSESHFNNSANILTSETTNTYGSAHKQVVHSVTTIDNGLAMSGSAYYPQDIINPDATIQKLIEQNRLTIPVQTESHKGPLQVDPNATQSLIQSQNVIYENWNSNDLILPETIQTAKGTNDLTDRIVYYDYDDNGNPLEVSKADGVHIVYIWGYHQSMPIAKIENATYAQVQGYVSNLQTLSNADNDRTLGFNGAEGALRQGLDALRNNFPNAMISTYTYDPLVGVTSMTDAKGYTMYYEYDNFNRLGQVKDAEGNILTKNEYKYATQN